MRILLILAFVLSAVTAFAKGEQTTEVFTLDHQMSAMCAKRINENLRFEKGISKIDVSVKENTITIKYDPQKTNTEKIIEGFKKIGFTAFPVEPEGAKEECTGSTACPHGCCAPPEV